MRESDLHCIVCEEDFSDEVVPRNLDCGHTLCTLCINHYFLKDKEKICPECRQPFVARCASALPVNYPLLRLSRSVSSQGSSSKECHTSNLQWNSKVVIEDHGAGPVWRSSPFEFTCKISTPKKQSEFFGMKNYIAYTVLPSFSSKHVLRRYKQFDMIQEHFKVTFPQVILPKLPEKQIFGKFDENLIDYRKRSLQTWIDRICHHPLLSQSDIFRLFITVSNEKSWKLDGRKMKNEDQVCRSFFSSVEVPKTWFDLSQADTKLESYFYFVNELEMSIKELLRSSLVRAESYQIDYKPDKERISRAFLKVAHAFSLVTCESPELPALVLGVSEAYCGMADLSTAFTEQVWQSLIDLLTEYESLIEQLKVVYSIAKRYVTKAFQMELSDYQDATVASLVFQAEIANFNKGLVSDIKKIIKDILQREYEFYQSVTNQLRKSLEKFMEEGKEGPSAPSVELLE